MNNRKLYLSILFIICVIKISAQDLVYVKKEKYNNFLEIYVNSVLSGKFQEKDKTIGLVKVSPSTNYVAVILAPDDARDYHSVENNLKILNSSGEVLHNLNENVRYFDWSEDGKKIVLLVGRFYDGSIRFILEKILIYNLENNKKTIIPLPHEKANVYDIIWSPGDKSILLRTLGDLKVYEYNLSSQKLSLTNLNDVNISPDGKYYYQRQDYVIGKDFVVFRIKDNTKVNIDPQVSTFNNRVQNEFGNLIGWDPNNGHVLLFKKKIEDVEFVDHIIQKENKTKGLDNLVLRDYKKRELKGIEYSFFDVEENTKTKHINSDGSENNLIISKHDIIYQDPKNKKLIKYKK
jgi:hypothetical protein